MSDSPPTRSDAARLPTGLRMPAIDYRPLAPLSQVDSDWSTLDSGMTPLADESSPPWLGLQLPESVSAWGHFECRASLQALTSSAAFRHAGQRTPVQVRFARCGDAAAADSARGARRFVVRFGAEPGGTPGWPLPGCSLPLAPDTPTSLTPPADSAPLAPWLWLMSDRALPRSYRMMQGFGMQTFRLEHASGEAVYARFHWLPAAGTHALAADEADQLARADPQFLRHDLAEAIVAGAFPRWQLALQVFGERQANSFDFDPFDTSRMLPEDRVPLRGIGWLVLNRLAHDDEADAELETLADPAEADGDDTAAVTGIVPCHSLPPSPAERMRRDLIQARLFWRSQSRVEQTHLIAACRAAIGPTAPAPPRSHLLERLAEVDPALASALSGASMRRSGALLRGEPGAASHPATQVQPSSTLSLLARPGERSVRMRRIAMLLADGYETHSLRAVQRALSAAGAQVQCVGPRAGAVWSAGGDYTSVELSIDLAPSALWDAVVLPEGSRAQAALARSDDARRFILAQYRHGKPILQLGPGNGLLVRLGIPRALPDGRVDTSLVLRPQGDVDAANLTRRQISAFLEALSLPRRFDRVPEPAPLIPVRYPRYYAR
ncbi:catalase [Aquincola sp. S2]|uniref:catalase n=1 Tax=Pseudaquabacterium terrae TaxID=2732868 RepID=A0ABX2EHT8_9BURK|nr:catalase [Aquabacterium terrae]NRF68194.1 catalase [Aquabacterium terrae]